MGKASEGGVLRSGELRRRAAEYRVGLTQMPFTCTYCNCDHIDAARSVEHIVPERLGNRAYVHRDTCARMNQGLAHFVESPFHTQSTLGEILITLEPPRGLTFRYEAATARGTTEAVFLDRGKPMLGDLPKYEKADSLRITLRRRDGKPVEYELKLPSPVLRNVFGSELFLTEEKLAKRVASERDKLTDYANKLVRDPDADPEFAQFVRDNDIELRAPTLDVELNTKTTPKSEVHDLIPREYVTDIEVSSRYFAKIAVLFAAQTGHGRLLDGADGTLIREFLQSVFVPPNVALGPYGKLWPFFSEATVAGEAAYAWAASVDQTTVAINTTADLRPEDQGRLLTANEARASLLNSVLSRIWFERHGDIGPAFHDAPRKYGVHELRFVTREAGEARPGLWCRISLFSELFVVEVRLAPVSPDPPIAAHKRIQTRWHATS